MRTFAVAMIALLAVGTNGVHLKWGELQPRGRVQETEDERRARIEEVGRMLAGLDPLDVEAIQTYIPERRALSRSLGGPEDGRAVRLAAQREAEAAARAEARAEAAAFGDRRAAAFGGFDIDFDNVLGRGRDGRVPDVDEDDVEQVDLGEAAIADVSDSDDEISGSIIVS